MAVPRSEVCDLIVIGLGPAGAACALQAQRDGLAVLGVDEAAPGGLISAARRVENLVTHPGGISGDALARRLARSLKDAAVPLRRARVLRVEAMDEGEAPAGLSTGFQVTLGDPRPDSAVLEAEARPLERLYCRAVCIATGTAPRGLPPELQRISARCHRDIRSLPTALEGRRVLVIGGGDAALDSALSVVDRGGQALVLVRGERPRAAAHLLEALEGREIDLLCSSHVCGVEEIPPPGAPTKKITVAYRRGQGASLEAAPTLLEVDELLACVGREPRRELACPDADSSIKGLFFAGDVLRPPGERFIAPAMGDGVRVALEVVVSLPELPADGRP